MRSQGRAARGKQKKRTHVYGLNLDLSLTLTVSDVMLPQGGAFEAHVTFLGHTLDVKNGSLVTGSQKLTSWDDTF